MSGVVPLSLSAAHFGMSLVALVGSIPYWLQAEKIALLRPEARTQFFKRLQAAGLFDADFSELDKWQFLEKEMRRDEIIEEEKLAAIKPETLREAELRSTIPPWTDRLRKKLGLTRTRGQLDRDIEIVKYEMKKLKWLFDESDKSREELQKRLAEQKNEEKTPLPPSCF